MKKATKDELFLLKLYEMATALGSPEEEVDRYVIGRAIGQNDHGVDTIIKHLAQANFVKKSSGDALYLTPHGLKLVEELRKERSL
jgi:Mn-dependent DtxR family transcriptional regulator